VRTSALAALSLILVPGAQPPRDRIRFGLVDTMFRDTPVDTVQASIDEFKTILQRETGRPGESLTVKDATALAEQLLRKEVQIGACLGYEFAWVKEKHPELRPLVVAVNQQRYVKALLLVKADGPVKDFAALRGTTLAQARKTKAFCGLFVERRCRQAGSDLKDFFGQVAAAASVEEAIDDVVDGAAQAVLVDSVGLERYQARKPARFAKLRELERSPPFPPTAVFYLAGGVDESTLDRYRKALLKLDQTPKGQQILLEWKLTRFEPVPTDYEPRLQEIRKHYPARGD
jgi:ABC-type phosphate/phosphonate transport system substrate-binding protein